MSRVAERAFRRWRLMLLASGTPIRITLITQHHWRKQFKGLVYTVQGAGQTSVSHSHTTFSLTSQHQGRLDASSLSHTLPVIAFIDFSGIEAEQTGILFCMSGAEAYWRNHLKQWAVSLSGVWLMEYWYKCKVILKKPTVTLLLLSND